MAERETVFTSEMTCKT